jgi:cellulose synthase operon protein YhjQ
MDSRDARVESPVAGTPEDVAALYAWANLHGAKYRDFSASRREYRAQIRYRAAQMLRERELKAQAEAEAAALAAERAAAAAEAMARSIGGRDSQAARMQALRSAEAAARKAAAERVEAQRRGESAAIAAAVAEREEREIAEAHASAQRQALDYSQSEIMRRQLAGPQPRGPLPGTTVDPYTSPGSGVFRVQGTEAEADREMSSRQFLAEPPRPSADRIDRSRANVSPSTLNLSRETAPLRRDGNDPGLPSEDRVRAEESALDRIMAPPARETAKLRVPPASQTVRKLDTIGGDGLGPAPLFEGEAILDPEPDGRTVARALDRAARNESTNRPEPKFSPEEDDEQAGPAWLYAPQAVPPPPQRQRTVLSAAAPHGGDTLQDSRERVAARWFALKGVFENTSPELPAMHPVEQEDAAMPLLLVFSLAGGVGKTSLAATLGRALSALGEKVVLTDTTSHGLLPFYFGARELRPGVVHSFPSPAGSKNAAISLVSYDLDPIAGQPAEQESLTEEILNNGEGNNRMVLDLGPSSSWLVRRMARLHPTILVPVSPDMNSVISLQSVERFFHGMTDVDGHPVLPFYVLNQFDTALPLHLDVREVFRRQLGERLLPVAIRRSPAVSEALAEGMTVVDYAPDAPVSKDYLEIAAWLRGVSPPAAVDQVDAGGSER